MMIFLNTRVKSFDADISGESIQLIVKLVIRISFCSEWLCETQSAHTI